MGEINKSITFSVTTTLNVKWILAETVPTTPDGYKRMSEFDISLGDLGTLWAFKKA